MTERVTYGPDGLARAAAILLGGGTVAFPTETVYGLGARADRSDAVRSIFAAKGRPPGNPLIVHVSGVTEARALAAAWPDVAERLAQRFWPGPLTLVVRRRAGAIVDEVTAGGETLAIRVPAHPVARALVERTGVPIAAPSANRSTAISPTTASHVMKSLGGRIDLVLDGGPTARGIESTIVDITRDPVALLRHGAIPIDVLAECAAIVDAAGESALDPSAERAPAPGSYARHYAPRARLVVVAPGAVRLEADARSGRGERVGVVDRGETGASGPLVHSLPDEPAAYGAKLYATLHELDDAGCDAIIASEVPSGARWAAVRDRLRRGSHRG